MSETGQTDQPAKQSPWVNWAVMGVIVLAVYLIFNFRPFDGFGRGEHPAVGHLLPLVELKGLTGTDETVTRDDLKGRVVLINFWATWCGPCRDELPQIAKLHKDFHGLPDVKVLAVSVGPADSDEDLQDLKNTTADLLSLLKVDLPTYADPGDLTRKAFEGIGETLGRSGVSGVPTTVVLDRNGIIRGVWVGYDAGSEERMQELVIELMETTPDP